MKKDRPFDVNENNVITPIKRLLKDMDDDEDVSMIVMADNESITTKPIKVALKNKGDSVSVAIPGKGVIIQISDLGDVDLHNIGTGDWDNAYCLDTPEESKDDVFELREPDLFTGGPIPNVFARWE